ncbi:magnesium transporter [Alkalicoccus saliphilus]|uniref:Magnesium transporter MgtE n=1 Tax=Alkalicoccus saliphilus TaxID=200989 RepID=A0A2T4U5F0_9BACI|nr:magnesium transporter [Alkalicoccus saliphilus]PTL38631.1 magnesium transporter [Alkalicoccus saliphilus]
MVKLNQYTRDEYKKFIISKIDDEASLEVHETMMDLHPTDRSEIYRELTELQRHFIHQVLSPKEIGEIFEQLETEEQERFIQEVDERYAASMFDAMYADDAADFLAEMKEEKAKEILGSMHREEAEEVRELMSYEEGTAGALMTKEFIILRESEKVKDVLVRLRKEAPEAETIYYLYVIDDDHKLAGVVSLRDLIIADPENEVVEPMSTRVVSVDTEDDQEDIARLIKKYDFLAVPVVTKQNTLVGIITVDDILDVVEEETEEDFGEISGTRGSLDAKISSFEAAKKRAPWIIILMFLGLITANVIGQFEETLEAVVLLSVFIPLIMDSAGNTGTQALAVMVRRLAVGSLDRGAVLSMVRREFGTGILLGLFCAVTLLILIPFFYGSFMLAGIVGLSLFLTLSVATIVGAVIPIIINKLKIDPAVASGPFITTLNDVIGLMIYFSIATAMLQYLPQ